MRSWRGGTASAHMRCVCPCARAWKHGQGGRRREARAGFVSILSDSPSLAVSLSFPGPLSFFSFSPGLYLPLPLFVSPSLPPLPPLSLTAAHGVLRRLACLRAARGFAEPAPGPAQRAYMTLSPPDSLKASQARPRPARNRSSGLSANQTFKFTNLRVRCSPAPSFAAAHTGSQQFILQL